MKDTTKKALAREWLYLLVGLPVPVGVVVTFGIGLVRGQSIVAVVGELFGYLFAK